MRLLLPLLLLPSTLLAQLPGMDPAVQNRLAVSYLRVEYAYRAHPPAGAANAAANQAFDRATLMFFGGRFDEAIGVMDSLAAGLDPAPGAMDRYAARGAERMGALAASRRVLVVGRDSVPYQVMVPANASGPLPLVIALHGAGADERAFLEAYGAGRLRELAEERRFVLVSPFTNAWGRNPGAAFDAAVEAATTLHPIDRSRIYVMGHSLGAGATWATARVRSEQIAAIACLAGGCGAPPANTTTPAPMPRTLLIAGELDPLAAPARLETAVARGREAGYAIDYRVVQGAGHTLLVGPVLDDVVQWLLGGAR